MEGLPTVFTECIMLLLADILSLLVDSPCREENHLGAYS